MCGLALSGVETSKEPKESQVHVCSSCVKTVVQTFTHYQEQIAQLNQEKESLQVEIRNLIKDDEERRRATIKEVSKLKKRLALLEKNSETNI